MNSCVLSCGPSGFAAEELQLHALLDPVIQALASIGVSTYYDRFDTPTLARQMVGNKNAILQHCIRALQQRDFLLVVMATTNDDIGEIMCARPAGKPCVVAVHSTVDQQACYLLELADAKFMWASTEELCRQLLNVRGLLESRPDRWLGSSNDLATGHSMDQHLPKPSSATSSVMHYRADQKEQP